jgi:hypothetical protein
MGQQIGLIRRYEVPDRGHAERRRDDQIRAFESKAISLSILRDTVAKCMRDVPGRR